MNLWRNAIAHNDFDQNVTKLGELDGQLKPRLIEGQGHHCRVACNHLVRQFDAAVTTFLGQVVGAPPW